LLRRPKITWAQIIERAPQLADISRESSIQIEYDVKYAGYVSRQEQQVDRQKRLSEKKIPDHFDYAMVKHLRTEAREKLLRIRPITLSQAGRISGITPADLALVLTYLEGGSRRSAN